jgi:hypothetical protein
MTKIKILGMIHIPGKNDKQWEEFINNNKDKVIPKYNSFYAN